MNKIDWKRKLTSRKFWISIASFVAMLIIALGHSQETATQVTSLIMAGATVIGYLIGEGLADYANAGNIDDGGNPQAIGYDEAYDEEDGE